MSEALNFSKVPSILESFGFDYKGTFSQMWFTFVLNDADNGYMIESKFNHVCIWHINEDGSKVCGEPMQFHLKQPNDLKIILNALIV